MVETCCGCFPLGFGTTIIMFITLIASLSFLISQITYSSNLLNLGKYHTERDYVSKFFILFFGAGVLTSVLGIIGVFQIIRDFVLIFYYYLLFIMAAYLVNLLILVIDTNFFLNVVWKALSHGDALRNYEETNLAMTIGIGLLILVVLTAYFAVVVRSFYWMGGRVQAYIRPMSMGYYSKSHNPQPSN